MCEMTCRSLWKPSARKRTTTGMSCITYGMITRTCPPPCAPAAAVCSSPRRYMTADMADRGLLSLPTCDRISATHDSFDGGFLLKQYTRLYACRSCATSTFSLPLMTK